MKKCFIIIQDIKFQNTGSTSAVTGYFLFAVEISFYMSYVVFNHFNLKAA